ncbi:uncharacterized protein LOC129892967 [Solanum dulcamara]|uniref:uncharacterized protein LOC129892967 n=1 Tax=Solanum dulcamara TaxID=45834 RepID=UPI0024863BD4|nr:uncharacterized protein LOC129892967 [Solanum dulcamara]
MLSGSSIEKLELVGEAESRTTAVEARSWKPWETFHNCNHQVKKIVIEHGHPLYVHPSDTSGCVLASVKLTGFGNYGVWSRVMRISLLAKKKLGFVTGTCTKESFDESLHEQWETVNAIVLSWIMNTVSERLLSGIMYASNAHLVWEDLKESFDKVNRVRIFQVHTTIANVKQRISPVSVYFSRLKELWSESDLIAPSPNCGCPKSRDYIEYLQEQRLMQFLSGLNESYDQAKRQILMKSNAPSVNQAYALIVQDESQQVNVKKSNPIAMQAKRNDNYKGSNSIYCENCHMRNHTKKEYYKLVGYPSERDGRANRKVKCTYDSYRKDNNNREGWKKDRYRKRYKKDNNEGWRKKAHAVVANNADCFQGKYVDKNDNGVSMLMITEEVIARVIIMIQKISTSIMEVTLKNIKPI